MSKVAMDRINDTALDLTVSYRSFLLRASQVLEAVPSAHSVVHKNDKQPAPTANSGQIGA
jgi:hypothetical protein